MATAEPAMSPSAMPVSEVLDRIAGPRRAEAEELLELHREVTGLEPVVWAKRILGFGEVGYAYESGRTGRMPELAFAPGAARHTLYLTPDFADRWPDLIDALGPHKASKVCLYLTRLTKIDMDVLREFLVRALAETRSGQGS